MKIVGYFLLAFFTAACWWIYCNSIVKESGWCAVLVLFMCLFLCWCGEFITTYLQPYMFVLLELKLNLFYINTYYSFLRFIIVLIPLPSYELRGGFFVFLIHSVSFKRRFVNLWITVGFSEISSLHLL